jgi:epoxyqueuosine reductase QueG
LREEGDNVASQKPLKDPGAWVTSVIREVCAGPDNALTGPFDEPAWAEPLVGFVRGDDPLYEQYKEVVGPYHWTPLEIFGLTYPESAVQAEELTVISWVLPQTKATKADNRQEAFYPAERWARSRIFGEAFNNLLRDRVAEALNEVGYPAVAPMRSPLFESKSSERFVYSSTWSERHAAYAAGLGTFGLCDGLITCAGKAMRVGSVVAQVQIPPTPRPYTDHHAYCLFYSQGICGVCADRCPVGAISTERAVGGASGHDKRKCRAHLHPTTSDWVQSEYGFDGYGCGLCQSAVPCESKIPAREDVS